MQLHPVRGRVRARPARPLGPLAKQVYLSVIIGLSIVGLMALWRTFTIGW